MKTIMPDGKEGVWLVDIPIPEIFENSVLCKVTHSLISPGTERGIIKTCVGKSKDEIVRQGNRLGYCGAGVVEEVKGKDIHFKKGERVAFYGAPYVSHSEYVVVPENLILPIPENVESECASFIGLGAISLHGFRLGKISIGDICLVAGAGIIGNLCAQIALLSGCKVIVSDFNSERLEAFENCFQNKDDYICINPEMTIETILKMSENQGADAVFLCMSTDSSQPIEQAIKIVRAGGRIVVVGVLDIHIPREEFFLKEAEITISRAAGPGRYDVHYEKEGIDYPPQYVRWTEGRNLKEVLHLITNGRLNVQPLISRIFAIDNVDEAYSCILKGTSDLGIIIKWT